VSKQDTRIRFETPVIYISAVRSGAATFVRRGTSTRGGTTAQEASRRQTAGDKDGDGERESVTQAKRTTPPTRKTAERKKKLPHVIYVETRRHSSRWIWLFFSPLLVWDPVSRSGQISR